MCEDEEWMLPYNIPGGGVKGTTSFISDCAMPALRTNMNSVIKKCIFGSDGFDLSDKVRVKLGYRFRKYRSYRSI